MDDQNKRDFSDFFSNKDEQKDRANEQQSRDGIEKPQHTERPVYGHEDKAEETGRFQHPSDSYYYSYGPFKSNAGEADGKEVIDVKHEEPTEVEVTEPRTVQPYSNSDHQPPASSGNRWDFEKSSKKKSSFRGIFASFLAGAVVVGTLMFSADQFNWFTNDAAPVMQNNSGSSAKANTTSASGTGNVSTALDTIRPNNISEIVNNASPAVVKIQTYVKAKQRGQGNSLFDDPFFRQFFGDDGTGQSSPDNNSNNGGQLQESGLGSGFIFDKSGYVLTNRHVIADADEIEVVVEGYEKPFKAELLGNSSELDLAVLKIENSKDLPYLPLGNSDDVNIGDWLVAIGNPYGFDHTVTVGVLSATDRSIPIQDESNQQMHTYEHLLQTDASINPGNSGGPLLNLNGEVIGINTAVSSQAQGIGFAIPTSTINSVVGKLKDNKPIPKTPSPFIGVTLSDIDKTWLKDLNVDSTDGAFVQSVLLNGPAYKADIRTYDIISEMDGDKIKTSQDLVDAIGKKKVGDKVKFTVIRGGKSSDITITIGDKNKYQTQE